MASRAELRTLVYTYLGTPSSDPMYPSATLDSLLEDAERQYVDDLQQANPDWLSTSVSISSATRDYALPADFGGYLEVRLGDTNGRVVPECRFDELLVLGHAGVPAFAITGADASATLHLSTACSASGTIALAYTQEPAVMAADTDVPTWMPTRYHSLLAKEAAIVAFGLGNESAPPGWLLESRADQRARFWLHVMKRGTQAMRTRTQVKR